MDQYIGKLLDNRYELLELIGSGGMARVYKARCHRLNRLVAVKILREELAQDAEFRRRFHDESQAVAMLSHPNIVAVYDVSRSSQLEYIVMELIDGITLKQYMQKKGNKLNWREALHFITQVVRGLGHAHSRGIIHRDIKPHNIMVLRDGSVKVSDFGIARVASGNHSTLTQEVLGSVHYISPEQARGGHIDNRSDLYSAGVVLYEMVTGRLPFEGDTPVSVAIQHINSIPLSPRELDSSIPEALEKITMKAMAPNPANRYSSADEMLADLEEFRKNPNINFDYDISEFAPEKIDEEATRMRTGVERRSSQPSHRRRTPRYEEPDEEPHSGAPWIMAASVAAVLLFVVGVFYFLFRTIFSDMFTPAQTFKVPQLVGEVYEEVAEDTSLLQDHFTVVVQEQVADDAEPGTIIEQSPVADSEVGVSVTEIQVTVSAGPDVVYMPDLFNMEYREAFLALDDARLKYNNPTYEHHDEIAKNHVISFTPLEDMPLAPGTYVDMVVSLGPKVKEVTMPSLLERTKEQAISDINMMNLQVGSTEDVYSDTIDAGKVAGQYPVPSEVVQEGTVVNLQISKGPDPATRMVTKTIVVPMPTHGERVLVTVMMGDSAVFSDEVDTAMNLEISFPVTASGTQELIVYIDGVRSKTIIEEFVP